MGYDEAAANAASSLPSTTRSLRIRSSYRTLRSIELWSATAIFSSSFATVVTKFSLVVFRRWEAVNREQWRAPLYWELHDGEWMIRDFSGLASSREQKRRACFVTSVFSKRQRLQNGRANDCRPKPNGRRRRVMMRSAKSSNAFPWGDADPDSGKANLFENGFWSWRRLARFRKARTLTVVSR